MVIKVTDKPNYPIIVPSIIMPSSHAVYATGGMHALDIPSSVASGVQVNTILYAQQCNIISLLCCLIVT